MKRIFLAVAVIIILSCNNTRVMSASNLNEYGRTEQVTDTFIHSLQQNNELVLAFAVETYAWAKTISYHILVKNKNEWKGYNYFVSITGGGSQKKELVKVSNDECNAVWSFMQSKEAWKITGDKGEDFCCGAKKSNCNINDGTTWRLLIITKDKVTDPSYYEPAFFEKCCPGNEERKLFLEATDKIKHAVPAVNGEEE